MTKELRKAIMNRSKQRNKLLKTRNEKSISFLIAKEISVLACSLKLENVFSGKLENRVVSENRRFWNKCRSSFFGEVFSQRIYYFE